MEKAVVVLGRIMGRGFFAFLVLVSFLPSAIYALQLYSEEASAASATRQAMLEQQAIIVRGQDFEESFWRAVGYGADMRRWASAMRSEGVEVWYGDSRGQAYGQLANAKPTGKLPKARWEGGIAYVDGGGHDAVIARIRVGNSTGIWLIPQGSEHEYN